MIKYQDVELRIKLCEFCVNKIYQRMDELIDKSSSQLKKLKYRGFREYSPFLDRMFFELKTLKRAVGVQKYCCEPIERVQNFNLAFEDGFENWVCHHRRETEDENGKSVFVTSEHLKENDMYFAIPASELIFLPKDFHNQLHATSRKKHKKPKQLVIPVRQMSKSEFLYKEYLKRLQNNEVEGYEYLF